MTASVTWRGASRGTKWPTAASRVTVTSAKNSLRRSPHAGGNSGSHSGHRTVVGTVIGSPRSSVSSRRLVATVPDPARYQATDAENAPGTA